MTTPLVYLERSGQIKNVIYSLHVILDLLYYCSERSEQQHSDSILPDQDFIIWPTNNMSVFMVACVFLLLGTKL